MPIFGIVFFSIIFIGVVILPMYGLWWSHKQDKLNVQHRAEKKARKKEKKRLKKRAKANADAQAMIQTGSPSA